MNKPRDGFTPDGKINIQEFYVGKNGVGKSTLALSRLLTFQQKHQSYVVAHDVGGNIPQKLYNGRQTNVMYFDDFDESRRVFRHQGGRGIHAFRTLDWEGVVNYAREVGTAAYDGKRNAILYIDEVANMPGATTHNKLHETMLKVITQRRHADVNCGLYICSQWPQICHYAIYGNATSRFVFRLDTRQSIDGARRFLPAESEQTMAEQIPKLPDHKYLEISG